MLKPNSSIPPGRLRIGWRLTLSSSAERKGLLKPGQTVVEATSGNTGIGLAMVCSAKGYPLVVTMADSFSIERRKLMRFLGAKVILTPRAAKGYGMYQKAVELAQANGWFLARQFETDANAEIHENTTAREILADFSGDRLDYWVTGYGTGGTISGVGRVLRKKRPETKIVLSEPANAQLIGSGIVQQRSPDHAPAVSHPAFEPHPVQGWTPDFIPYVLQESIDQSFYDELIPIPGPKAIEWSRKLAQKEGILDRHFRRCDVWRSNANRGKGGPRRSDLVHVAGHGRTIFVFASVRGNSGRDDTGGNYIIGIDARLSHGLTGQGCSRSSYITDGIVSIDLCVPKTRSEEPINRSA